LVTNAPKEIAMEPWPAKKILAGFIVRLRAGDYYAQLDGKEV
jgi:hypothetical protein